MQHHRRRHGASARGAQSPPNASQTSPELSTGHLPTVGRLPRIAQNAHLGAYRPLCAHRRTQALPRPGGVRPCHDHHPAHPCDRDLPPHQVPAVEGAIPVQNPPNSTARAGSHHPESSPPGLSTPLRGPTRRHTDPQTRRCDRFQTHSAFRQSRPDLHDAGRDYHHRQIPAHADRLASDHHRRRPAPTIRQCFLPRISPPISPVRASCGHPRVSARSSMVASFAPAPLEPIRQAFTASPGRRPTDRPPPIRASLSRTAESFQTQQNALRAITLR